MQLSIVAHHAVFSYSLKDPLLLHYPTSQKLTSLTDIKTFKNSLKKCYPGNYRTQIKNTNFTLLVDIDQSIIKDQMTKVSLHALYSVNRMVQLPLYCGVWVLMSLIPSCGTMKIQCSQLYKIQHASMTVYTHVFNHTSTCTFTL